MPYIGFNKPYFTGKEIEYIVDAVAREKISGNGYYTQRCQQFLETRYGVRKALLTTSCTDALEMAALLIDIGEGDEVIMPSYTFVSTANAFILRGAKVVFADSSPLNPNVTAETIAPLVTARTRAIVVVHYAGIACDMDPIMALVAGKDISVIEDAAQAIESTYKGKPLGAIGHLGCFSFHETKNIISGEGGALLVNDDRFVRRAEIIWEKGTDRSAFFRGEVDKYGWIDVGSSFLPSDITAAFLYAQLERIDEIQHRRQAIWQFYHDELAPLKGLGAGVPEVPSFCRHNAHIFYLVCRSEDERNRLLEHLNQRGVNAIFHYLSLHKSRFYLSRYDLTDLPWCDHYQDRLVRLPLFHQLSDADARLVVDAVKDFFYDR